MKILYGVQKPDDGEIRVAGEPRVFKSPTDAIAVGIGMVFQHFMLADNLTALENVVLGAEKLFGIGDKARDEFRGDLRPLRLRPAIPTSSSSGSASPTGSASRSSRSSSAARR